LERTFFGRLFIKRFAILIHDKIFVFQAIKSKSVHQIVLTLSTCFGQLMEEIATVNQSFTNEFKIMF